MENSERDGNTRPPDLPLEKPICSQEATVRTGHGTTDWFQIGKGVRQGCILSPCLFSVYAEYIMRNTGLEEAQAGIKIAGRNINYLGYADDITLMAESEEEPKSLLMKVKRESEKGALKLNSGHGTGKGQFSFQSRRKAMPKNAQTTAQLHSSNTLVNNAQNCPSQASAVREP